MILIAPRPASSCARSRENVQIVRLRGSHHRAGSWLVREEARDQVAADLLLRALAALHAGGLALAGTTAHLPCAPQVKRARQNGRPMLKNRPRTLARVSGSSDDREAYFPRAHASPTRDCLRTCRDSGEAAVACGSASRIGRERRRSPMCFRLPSRRDQDGQSRAGTNEPDFGSRISPQRSPSRSAGASSLWSRRS